MRWSNIMNGLSRVLDLAPGEPDPEIRAMLENRRQELRRSPKEKLAEDWQRVGENMRRAMRQYEREHANHPG